MFSTYFEGNRRLVPLIVFLEVAKKGKEEFIIILFNNFYIATGKLIDSGYPPLPRPYEKHLNITFYLNRRMKFVFVLSLMLCYSSAQSADSSEYIVQSNLCE